MPTRWPSSSWWRPWRRSWVSAPSDSASTTRTSRTCEPSVTPSTTCTPSSGPVDGPPVDGLDDGAARLARRLEHEFADPSLLAQALAHRSWCGEQDGAPSNERLEFLGDAVLGLVVAEHSYRLYPDLPEGQLAKIRAAVVNAR